MPTASQMIPVKSRAHATRRLPFGAAEGQRTHILIHKNENYIVPMIARAIDISERLRGFRKGVSVEQLQEMTGYSKSSIYRILRTLAAFDYVARDERGRYRLSTGAPRS